MQNSGGKDTINFNQFYFTLTIIKLFYRRNLLVYKHFVFIWAFRLASLRRRASLTGLWTIVTVCRDAINRVSTEIDIKLLLRYIYSKILLLLPPTEKQIYLFQSY